MELYIINFYDANESWAVEHNELYSTLSAAERRYNSLANKLNGYSWVCLSKTKSVFGRIRTDALLKQCMSCHGKDNYYHGDDSDF